MRVSKSTMDRIARDLIRLACVFAASIGWGSPNHREQFPPARPEYEEQIPLEIREAWLRFHEEGLCQDLDAVFSLQSNRVEVWCLIGEEKPYQRLCELLTPLRAAGEVHVYATRPAPVRKGPDQNDPPPSLWNNREIRNYLSDPLPAPPVGGGMTVRTGDPREASGDQLLRQRMAMFAEQILEWGKQMRQHAQHLPALSEAAFGARAIPSLRGRALACSLEHARAVDRNAEKLMENLARALPRAARRAPQSRESAGSRASPGPPLPLAGQVSDAATTVARRVNRFIHPRVHTVGLVDLRDPSLLESLKTLRRIVADYERAAKGAR
jgi:hypothetical protein